MPFNLIKYKQIKKIILYNNKIFIFFRKDK